MPLLIFCLLLIGCLQPLVAQQTDSISTPTPASEQLTPDSAALGVLDCITNLPDDWLRFGRETFRWENAPLIGGIAISTIAAVVYDKELYDPVRHQYTSSKTVAFAMDRGVDIGDGKFQFGIAAGFAAYGWLTHDRHALRTASEVCEVILAAGGVVQLLKHVTGRESPFTATHPTGRWVLFPNQIEYFKHVPHYDAFPSGHVCTALATLTVVSENYPDARWLPYVGYPAIAWLGYSMVGQGIHWVSDYPLSIVLGYTFGKLVSHRKLFDGISSKVQTQEYPYVHSDGTSGINLQLSW